MWGIVACAVMSFQSGNGQAPARKPPPPAPGPMCKGCGAPLGRDRLCSYCRRMRDEPRPASAPDPHLWPGSATYYPAPAPAFCTQVPDYEPPAPSPAPSFESGGGGDYGGGGASGDY